MEQHTKLIYRFQYETATDTFHGYLDPSWDNSIISLKRLEQHGYEYASKLTFKKVTSLAHTINNKFENIVGMRDVKISFKNTSSGIKIGGTESGYGNGINGIGNGIGSLVEKKIDVLVLRESKMEFRLGNDFLTNNAKLERSNSKKENFTHQLRFEDGVTVELENVYVDEVSDDEAEENNGKSRKNSKRQSLDRFKKFKKVLTKLDSHVGLSNIVIMLLLLLSIILYSSESQSLIEDLVILPYNKQFTRPGIDNKLENYARKLKTTTSFLELYELDKHQNSKPLPLQHEEQKEQDGEVEHNGDFGERDIRGQELYTNLIRFTESLDNTKRTLLDMYNRETSYFWLFKQNVKNLLKYFSSKNSWTIPFVGGRYFPITKNFDVLINDVEWVIIENVHLVLKELITAQDYCDDIIFQLEKMKVELDSFIKDSSKPFSSWLVFLIRFGNRKGGNINNLGEIDYETALKFQKLLMALDEEFFEISKIFLDLRYYLNKHLTDLSEFLGFFKVNSAKRIKDWEIPTVKKYLVNLRNNRRAIFDEILVENDLWDDDEPLTGCRIRDNNIFECGS